MADWPHAPVHRLSEAGAYIVTAGTYRKEQLFRSPDRLTLLQETLLALAPRYGWDLQAWALFSNHYHFVALSVSGAETLRSFIRHLHSVTARAVNRLDATAGRQVWFEYWETHLTFERSYLARLNYVHNNAVRHGLVQVASDYPWCSAAWFERTADRSFQRTVASFNTDQVTVPDPFEPAKPAGNLWSAGACSRLSSGRSEINNPSSTQEPESGSKLPHSKSLYHVSDRADISAFEPRTTRDGGEKLVWAVDEEYLHNYLLPRDCPRVTWHADTDCLSARHPLMAGVSGRAVVAVEAGWLERIRRESLWVYRLPAESFVQRDAVAGYYVSMEAVLPAGVTRYRDLLAGLLDRDVELRIMPSLWLLRDAVIESGLPFSIIRMRNAQPPPPGFEIKHPVNP